MRERILERISRYGYQLEDFTEQELAQMEQEIKDEYNNKFEQLDGILATLTFKELNPQ